MTASAAMPGAAAGTRAAARPAGARLAPIISIFLIGLAVPFVFQAGPLRLSVYVIILSLGILPFVAMWLTGLAGRVRLPDIALLLFCFWVALSYGVIHGADIAIEASGIFFIETMGAYLLGRLFVRTPDDLYQVVRLLFWITLLLLPLAVAESVTGRSIALDLARSIHASSRSVYMDPRWGLRRAQTVFEHPILSGVFCSSIAAMTYFVLGYGCSMVRRLLQTAAVAAVAFLSLSSGPITAMGAQILLVGWDRLFKSVRQRWYVLGGLVLAGLAVIALFANRSPAQIVISYVAFSKSTAFNRLRIWEYGSASVMNNPLFGIGLNDWVRPQGMSWSVDMFWLLPAMRHGLLAGILLQAGFFGVFLAVLFRKGLGERWADYRTGYLISLMGLYMAGWTVHYWNAVYVLFMFLLGCGYCFLTDTREAGTPVSSVAPSSESPVLAHRRAHSVRRPVEPESQMATGAAEDARPAPRYSRQLRPNTRRDGT